MKISCPNCQTGYNIADEKIPAGGARASCPNCGQQILIPPVTGNGESSDPLVSSSSADFGRTIAYDFSEVKQSRTEVTELLQQVSGKEPFVKAGHAAFLRDTATGEEFPLKGASMVLGRTGADIRLSDPEVSRKHCLIKVYGDRFVVTDLGSTNGTFFQARKVMTAYLASGDTFSVGNTTLEAVLKKTQG